MISLQAIEENLKRYEERLWESVKKGTIAADQEFGKEHGHSEVEIQQEIEEDLKEARQHFEETRQNRYMLYEIYFTLKAKYGRDIANLAKEVLTAVIMGRMKQQELMELRTTIINMLGQEAIPPSAKIRELFNPIIWNYGDGEIKERMLQEIEQRRVLAEQQAEVERQQAEVERQQAEAERQQAEVERQQAEVERQQAALARKQREELAQANLLLQKQLLELEQQLQARGSQKTAPQSEESSPSTSSRGDSTQHSPQQQGVVPSSPIITTSFDMSTTRTQQLIAAKQEEPPSKKQCLRPLPSQDS